VVHCHGPYVSDLSDRVNRQSKCQSSVMDGQVGYKSL
jgi:hypothetical protein